MDNYEISERFAEMWRKSRSDAGKSQEYMARALGVSKKTIQNWEDGTSSPSQLKGFEWFDVLGLQALPYYLRLLYPEQFNTITAESTDAEIEDAIITYVKAATPDLKRKLLYLLVGQHGSSATAIMEMMTAHLHTPLRSRLNVALSIKTNYEIAEKRGEIIRPDVVPADIEHLNFAIELAKEAIVRADESYSDLLHK